MCEVIVIICLGLLYIIPLEGIIKVSEQEEEFLLAYNGFTLIQSVEESTVESLIGGSIDVEDVPTVIDFSAANQENTESDFQDIDIHF